MSSESTGVAPYAFLFVSLFALTVLAQSAEHGAHSRFRAGSGLMRGHCRGPVGMEDTQTLSLCFVPLALMGIINTAPGGRAAWQPLRDRVCPSLTGSRTLNNMVLTNAFRNMTALMAALGTARLYEGYGT